MGATSTHAWVDEFALRFPLHTRIVTRRGTGTSIRVVSNPSDRANEPLLNVLRYVERNDLRANSSSRRTTRASAIYGAGSIAIENRPSVAGRLHVRRVGQLDKCGSNRSETRWATEVCESWRYEWLRRPEDADRECARLGIYASSPRQTWKRSGLKEKKFASPLFSSIGSSWYFRVPGTCDK